MRVTNSRGDIPKYSRKALEKYECEEKPTRYATSDTLTLLFASR